MSLLMTIFLLVFITQVIEWVGKSVLSEFTYTIYLRITRSPGAAKQRALKAEILKNKSELLQTSAQDQFAKWAKLRRTVDKGLADLERLNTEVSASRASFVSTFNTLLWVFTTGLQFVVGWWYRKQAVFYLPSGWLGPVEYWLSFPFAPAGSVSVGVWQMACKRVLVVFERVFKAALGSRLEYETSSTGTRTPEEKPMPATNGTSAEAKKAS
ncbi:CHD5-like protein-domain-containing protein [Cyathus striatus]|nr:CHD5-like protein-domain-containing protein [Cyathus striatus]